MRSGSIASITDRKGVGKRVTPRRGLIAALEVILLYFKGL